ncbi:putative tRNA (cytidine(32)/guanosine(34)-2'-O)-methyltransferase [Blattella germanica]|nr:putative tRNA (cytidine(32)/guanosine(34)-2'-O)-methyltransferase [Blattella germanica]
MKRSSGDKRDIYYRLAKQEGWRARSAYKLLHIDKQFNIFKGVKHALDLCAAPGSWSQVLLRQLRSDSNVDPSEIKVVAVDLQVIAPLPGLIQIVGDITKVETAKAVIEQFKGEHCELVVCDGAPDVTGLHDIDEFVQGQLLLAAINITTYVLSPGGTFVAKIFRGKDVTYLLSQLHLLFRYVTITKPRSSRSTSIESFVICQKYQPLEGYKPTMFNPLLININDECVFTGTNKFISPYLACGNMQGLDRNDTTKLKLSNPEQSEGSSGFFRLEEYGKASQEDKRSL